MALVTKNDVTQIFAIQAPAIDLPPTFANYPRGWDTARSNNGKPTIKQFNYIQQRTDQNILYIHQNGAALPYDATMEYAEGAVVVKDGELQKKQGASWVSATNKGYNLDYFISGKSYPLHAEIMLTNGDIVKSTIADNTANPNIDMTGWVKTKVEIFITDFGADRNGVLSSNAAFRSALAYLESMGGGVLRVPSGSYRFERELNAIQPPITATFTSQTAGFWARENISIVGDGRDITKFIIPCPGQKKGAVDNTKFWQFLAHGDNFSLIGITFSGDVDASEFEFVSFWGGGIVPSFLVYANSEGTVFGKNSVVKNNRFKNTRGFCYATSLLHSANFTDNDVQYTNGVNLSGKDVHVDRNTWYMSELIESSGEPYALLNADKTAGITFNDNVCRECNGGAIGGNINTSDASKTFGYQFSRNVIINNILNANTGFSVTNNAVNCEIDGNIITGLFGIPLSVTSGGVGSAAPSDIIINGGFYKSTRVDLPSAVGISIGVDEGDFYINGSVLQGKNAGLAISGAGSSARVYLDGGVKLIGQYGISFGTTSATQILLGNYSWIPTTSNISNLASNMAGSTAPHPIKIVPRIVETKSGSQANSEIVEVNKKYGGSQADLKFCYFIRYLNGRIGWGDADSNTLADVYLERKSANVLGLDVGDCFKTGVSVTASRPSAASVGQGSQYFDSTLNKPIWSDGSVWRDASGAII